MSQYSKRKFNSSPNSTFERHKKPHVGINFSDLPTHLPELPTHLPESPTHLQNRPTHLPGSSIYTPSRSSNFPTSSIVETSDSGRTVESGELPEKIPENTLNGQTKDEDSKIVTTQPFISQVEDESFEAHSSSSKTSKADQKKDASADPIFIEGTNITLQTEEDIAHWIAERRKNWPTRKNVEAKLEEQKKDSENVQLPLQQNICKLFAKSGRCKFGTKCRYAHETTNNGSEKVIIKANKNTQSSQNQRTSGTRKLINGSLVNVPQRYKQEVNGSGSLFTKLVQRDLYEHENNVIIDFIQYLDSKGLINKDVSF